MFDLVDQTTKNFHKNADYQTNRFALNSIETTNLNFLSSPFFKKLKRFLIYSKEGLGRNEKEI